MPLSKARRDSSLNAIILVMFYFSIASIRQFSTH